MLRKVLLVLITVIAFSCNNDSKKKSQTANSIENEDVSKQLIVTVGFNTNKTGTFKLMLNNVIIDEFQKKNIHVLEKTKPTTATERIVAKFGENNISNSFQIGLGNKEVKEVEIEFIDFSYGNNKLHIKASDLSKYFTFNKFVTQDKETQKLKTAKVKGKHVPLITLKKSFIQKLRAE